MAFEKLPSPCMNASVADFLPFLEHYWEEFDSEDVYVGVVLATHVDRFGNVVGQSMHLNGPDSKFNDEFMRDLLEVPGVKAARCE